MTFPPLGPFQIRPLNPPGNSVFVTADSEETGWTFTVHRVRPQGGVRQTRFTYGPSIAADATAEQTARSARLSAAAARSHFRAPDQELTSALYALVPDRDLREEEYQQTVTRISQSLILDPSGTSFLSRQVEPSIGPSSLSPHVPLRKSEGGEKSTKPFEEGTARLAFYRESPDSKLSVGLRASEPSSTTWSLVLSRTTRTWRVSSSNTQATDTVCETKPSGPRISRAKFTLPSMPGITAQDVMSYFENEPDESVQATCQRCFDARQLASAWQKPNSETIPDYIRSCVRAEVNTLKKDLLSYVERQKQVTIKDAVDGTT